MKKNMIFYYIYCYRLSNMYILYIYLFNLLILFLSYCMIICCCCCFLHSNLFLLHVNLSIYISSFIFINFDDMSIFNSTFTRDGNKRIEVKLMLCSCYLIVMFFFAGDRFLDFVKWKVFILQLCGCDEI